MRSSLFSEPPEPHPGLPLSPASPHNPATKRLTPTQPQSSRILFYHASQWVAAYTEYQPHCLLFSCSVVSDSFETLWTVAHQAPLSMGFPRQEYWSGLPFPSPVDLPDPGIKPWSPALQADSLLLSHQGSPAPASNQTADHSWLSCMCASLWLPPYLTPSFFSLLPRCCE